MLRVCQIVTFLLFFGMVGATAADEMAARNETRSAAASLFKEADYAGLERMAADFRENQSRTPAGTWQLPNFYTGVAVNALNFTKAQDSAWEQAAASIDKWIEQYPNSPTPYIAKAAALMARGWTYRGTTYAREVAQEDMQKFQEFAVQAANILVDNAEPGAYDPHWYATLADVFQAIGIPKDDYLAFIDQGLEEYPNYDQLYFEGSGYLSAKWYGSDEELEAFAQAAVERTKSERGHELYARIYWAAGMRSRKEYSFQSPHANWHHMELGMDDVIERYPDQWNIQRFAYFSCYFWHEDAARKYMDLVEEPLVTQAWNPASVHRVCNNRIGKLDEFRREIDSISQ